MSVDGNRDDSTVALQYFTLQTMLLTDLNLLRQELTIVSESDRKRKWAESRLNTYFGHIADRRDLLIKIASQSLSSEDFGQFKDLAERTLKMSYSKYNLRKLRIVQRSF